jgi:DNA-binding transcriptional MerR regulator
LTLGEGPRSTRRRRKETTISNSPMDMTIGEFSMITGLTPKALRLYDERGILVPVAIDPVTGYRWYSAGQLRHGQLLWALREAGVPLADLADLESLDIEAYQERQRARREYEDTALRMAQAIKGVALDEWPVTSAPASEQPWVGTRVRLVLAEDGDPAAAFVGMSGTIHRHRAALSAALCAYGNEGCGPSWTTTPETAAGATQVDMLVCRPTIRDQREVDWNGFTEHIREHLAGEEVEAVAGVLPARLEVSCRAEVDFEDEAAAMAAGFAPRLAVEEYVRARGLQPLGRASRELGTLVSENENSVAVTVRDVKPPS